MSYRLAGGCSNSSPQTKTLAEGGINLIGAFCMYWSDEAVFSLLQKCVDNGVQALLNLAPANWPDEGIGSGGYCAGYEERLETFKNEAGLFGHWIEEPYMRGIPLQAAKDFYSYAKTKNSDWKIYCGHADDEWNRHGWNTDGYCDICGVNIYPCKQDDPAAYLTAKLVNLDYRDALRNMYDTWGIEICPILMAWDADTCPDCILIQYQTWESVIDRPIGNSKLAGAGYWVKSGFLPEAGGLTCIWNQIRSLNFTYLEAPFKLAGSLTFDKGFSWKTAIITIGKFLYGGLNFSGTLPKKHIIYPILSGKLSFSGTFGLTYTFLQSLTWTQLQNYTWKSVSVRRVFLKFISPLLSGAVSLSGSLNTKVTLLIKKVISGALAFSGALSHNFKLFLTAGIGFAGAINLKVKRSLSGAISPLGFIFISGTWLAICTKTYTFLETLTWSQFQSYTWCKPLLKIISLSGFLSPSGLLPKKVLSSLTGALSFVGSPFLKAKSVVTGALNSSGIFTKVFIKALLFGDVSFSSIIGRLIKKPLSGALSFLGWTQVTTGNLKYLLRKLIQLIQIKGW